MVSMQGKYLTVWNIGFQLSYFFLAFLCDICTVLSREHMIPNNIRKFRQFYFSTAVWPVATLIFVVFWPFFFTNRELLFPAFIDKIFSLKSNLVMHFCILPAVLWELVFTPRPVQTSHVKHIGALTFLFVLYNIVIIYTYSQRGIWPYPILNILYPTIYYQLLLVTLYLMVLWCYQLQWRITSMVWDSDRRTVRKNKI
ncbi:unnamed protein product [Arctia plantaginis]|uniref:Androgen-dependent TFPI-regulating protein n=1 Tax=Arctia plantaginis TaxID=874455 RepID=A0A8S1AA24_ARCPL|nr:unnamed protein product [Arctia plantaginis]